MDERQTLLSTMNENKLHSENLHSLIDETKSDLREMLKIIEESIDGFNDDFKTIMDIQEKIKDCLCKLGEEV